MRNELRETAFVELDRNRPRFRESPGGDIDLEEMSFVPTVHTRGAVEDEVANE
jgi:hypothetical protein